MELTVKILNGERKSNEPIRLSTQNLFFYEDEALEFTLVLDKKHAYIAIFFYETEIVYTEYRETKENKIEYIWKPKKHSQYGYERLFQNYFGIAELSLVVDKNKPIIYQMEILATKINADRTEKMLNFLNQQDNNVLWSFLRATRVNAGKSVGNISIDHLIDHLEIIVKQIEVLLNKIFNKPMVKVVPKTYYTDPKNNHSIDDTTIAWLADHVDMLCEVDNSTEALIELDNKFYSIHSLKTNILINDTDIYENQVLHGFIHRLRAEAKNIISKLNTSPNDKFAKNYAKGYESLFNQLNRRSKELNINKIKRSENQIKKLDLLLHRLNKIIPTKKIHKGTPTFTQKVKHNFLYLSYFKKIIEWDKHGKIDWSITEELFAIKNIPILFEYYLFFYIKTILENNLGQPELVNYNHSEIRFIFDKGSEPLSLEYQPRFWVKSHKEQNAFNLINSEKWYVNKQNNIKERSPSSCYSLRNPDIMLTYLSTSKEISCFIIDAKYTINDKIFYHYLPEVTLKYLHGIHHISSGKNHTIGLMLVSPSENENIRHFHHDDYDIYSSSPILPTLVCSSITIEDHLHLNQFTNLIGRIVEIMKDYDI